MDDENIYERIQDVLGKFPENLNILEEQIDIDLQMEYFEFSGNNKKNSIPDDIITVKDNLFDRNNSPDSKKKILVHLASLEDVEAYRTIESYLREPDKELTGWATLALQESRMLLHSKLLDEDQVFISTGLGGKGSKLRYFIVLLNSSDKPFDEFQKKIISSEFEFHLKRYEAGLEDISFVQNYCTMLAVVSIKESIRDIFKAAIDECNEYGGFILEHFIITNVRILSCEEIDCFIKKQKDSGTL